MVSLFPILIHSGVEEILWSFYGTGTGVLGGTPYNGLYEEAPPERGTSYRLEVYTPSALERHAILRITIALRAHRAHESLLAGYIEKGR